MKLNVITGLPRSGSTLLCNIINQNDRFWATSTSNLPQMINAITHTWSDSVEVKNLLEKHKEETEKKMYDSVVAFIEKWHGIEGKEIIFDKSRGWSSNNLMLKYLYPDAKIIVLVRDLRNVFSSIEKQHQKNPLLDEAQTPIAKTLYDRADKMFGPEGIIGSCIVGVEDLIRREPEGVVFVKYETLSSDPSKVMKKLYEDMGEEFFGHDFRNVKNTAIDCDGHYLHKYPHKGEGEIKPGDPDEWKKYVSDDIGEIIMERFPDYNKFFGYR